MENIPLKIKNKLMMSIASLIVGVVVFGGGYYAGIEHEKSVIPVLSGTNDTSLDMSTFWKVWHLIDEKSPKANTINSDARLYGAISGLASSLKDPYTVFFPPEENKSFQEDISGQFSGVGMEVGVKDKNLTVISPLKGTPAYRAGILAGDIIIKIDNTNTAGMTIEKAIDLIRGKLGTNVAFTIFRGNEKGPRIINVIRENISIPIIETEIKDDVFIIHLFSFSANSSEKFRLALKEFVLSKKTKLIIDLRGNPGGYLDSAVDMASWFLPKDDVIVKEDFGKNKEPKVYNSAGYNIFTDKLKLAILLDKGSASASEILAGALHDHHKAILVGETSYGKGSVQELLPITKDTSLKITIANWLTPNGIWISEKGIEPDYAVKRGEKDTKENDTQLNKAIEILK